jgi:hypothetical protein
MHVRNEGIWHRYTSTYRILTLYITGEVWKSVPNVLANAQKSYNTNGMEGEQTIRTGVGGMLPVGQE